MARMAAPAHWIAPNESNRVPRVHIVLDSEAVVTQTARGEEHTFRCAVTSCDRMAKNGSKWLPTEWAEHADARSVWEWIDAKCRPRSRTVVVAHNAGYDLRVTDALDVLADLGYKLHGLSLSPGATWGTWRRDGRTLVVVDSMTWLPTALDRIGRMIGHNKVALPGLEDEPALWSQRCRTDVEILRDAWMRIVHWLRDSDAGNWRPTGAGTAWSFWRHRHYTHPVLVHDNDEVRDLERRAAWTGRAEAWRKGRLKGGPWCEWDFTAAYARIAAECDVPTRLRGELPAARIDRYLRGVEGRHTLATCTVTTEVPVVPSSLADRIVWPVGRFETVLWDCEVQLARAAGATVEPHRAWTYIAQPALRSWATWVLDVIDNPDPAFDPIVRSMVKHWSRALIGRFGSRFATWDAFGLAVENRLDLSTIRFPGEDKSRRMLTIGDDVMVQTDDQDAPDSAPQIMSYVMAEARCRLWRAMVVAGLENVAYVDTDCVIASAEGSDRLRDADLAGFRIKAKYQHLEVIGTRKIVTDGELRAAGVPKGAVRVGDGLWSADRWEGLASSLKRNDGASVRVDRKTIRLSTIDRRRRARRGGTTEPIRVG